MLNHLSYPGDTQGLQIFHYKPTKSNIGFKLFPSSYSIYIPEFSWFMDKNLQILNGIAKALTQKVKDTWVNDKF